MRNRLAASEGSATQVPPATSAVLRRLVIFVVAVNLFLWAMVALALNRGRQESLADSRLTTQHLAQTLSISVASVLEKMEVGLAEIVARVERDLERGEVDGAELNQALRRQKPLILEFEDIWVADQNGEVHWGTNLPAGPPVRIGDRDYFRRAMRADSRLEISQPVVGRVTKAWSVLVAKRITRPDGSFAGVVLGSLRMIDYFGAMFAPIDIGPRSVIAVRGADMTIYYRWADGAQDEAQIGKAPISAEAQRVLATNLSYGTYIAVSGTDGVERTFSYRRATNYPLYVFVGQDIAESLSAWQREAAIDACLLLIFGVLSALHTWEIARRVKSLSSQSPGVP